MLYKRIAVQSHVHVDLKTRNTERMTIMTRKNKNGIAVSKERQSPGISNFSNAHLTLSHFIHLTLIVFVRISGRGSASGGLEPSSPLCASQWKLTLPSRVSALHVSLRQSPLNVIFLTKTSSHDLGPTFTTKLCYGGYGQKFNYSKNSIIILVSKRMSDIIVMGLEGGLTLVQPEHFTKTRPSPIALQSEQ